MEGLQHQRELNAGGLPDAEKGMVARRDAVVPNKAAQLSLKSQF